jgi:KUP system potassium uptake protein
MERHATNDLGRSTKNIRSSIENSSFFRGLLKTIGVLAVSMVMADGVLTPAQSVLGAVQGLSVVKPDISKSTIIGVTCSILIFLFVVQPLGISKLTRVFSPIVVVWLLLNAGFGVYNLAKYIHLLFSMSSIITKSLQVRLRNPKGIQPLLCF